MADFTIEIPESVENVALPDPDLFDYYRRLERRTIFINNEIDDEIECYAMHILEWNAQDIGVENPTPIKIFINSNGGSISPTFNLIDIIALSKTPVYTIGMGRCYSSGGLLLMAGSKRFIFPNTTALIHDGYSGSIDSVSKFLDSAKFTEKQGEKMSSFILSHTNIDRDAFEKNFRKDWFMFADDIIKYGVADKIITDLSEIDG